MDVNALRSNFPALDKEQVFFDNAGGSQVLGTVVDSIRDYLVDSNVQLGATYTVGKRASTSYENAYQAAAKYINASRDEIVLGASTTQLFRNVSATLNFQPGDELVLSAIDHEANIAPWVDLAERQQLVVKWWKPASKDAPKLLAQDLEALLSSKTRLVTCTHTSNILGTIHDVKAISATVHRLAPGALVCADAVAYAPHRKIDVKELGVDFYAFSWYKVYGPHIAVLYGKMDTAQKQMKSLGHFFNPHKTLEHKLGLAGGSYELMSGIPAVAAYMTSVGWEKIIAQEEALQGVLLGYLNGRKDVTVHGEKSTDGQVRVPTVAFTVEGWDSKELVETVEKDSPFAFRWGAFYSNRLVNELLGLDKSGVVRVSMVHYNTVDEVKGFVAALDKTLSGKK
ncbi:hypothetical protein N0V82_002668 [Gnomoniopsis sp. IMI 355080]|nr:hypothetical protein N0V82_002668 [Gnomoniopsis sp. IMI 355080]